MVVSSLTQTQIKSYHQDGFLILKSFFSKAEVDKMYGTALLDDTMRKNTLDLNDQTGKKTKLSLWLSPGNDFFALRETGWEKEVKVK
jgi:hypothetical protein